MLNSAHTAIPFPVNLGNPSRITTKDRGTQTEQKRTLGFTRLFCWPIRVKLAETGSPTRGQMPPLHHYRLFIPLTHRWIKVTSSLHLFSIRMWKTYSGLLGVILGAF